MKRESGTKSEPLVKSPPLQADTSSSGVDDGVGNCRPCGDGITESVSPRDEGQRHAELRDDTSCKSRPGMLWCVWCDCGVWCGVVCVVWCGVVLCGVVWCGVVWCGVVWCGVVWCGVCGVVWCGVVWCGVVIFNIEIPINSFCVYVSVYLSTKGTCSPPLSLPILHLSNVTLSYLCVHVSVTRPLYLAHTVAFFIFIQLLIIMSDLFYLYIYEMCNVPLHVDSLLIPSHHRLCGTIRPRH